VKSRWHPRCADVDRSWLAASRRCGCVGARRGAAAACASPVRRHFLRSPSRPRASLVCDGGHRPHAAGPAGSCRGRPRPAGSAAAEGARGGRAPARGHPHPRRQRGVRPPQSLPPRGSSSASGARRTGPLRRHRGPPHIGDDGEQHTVESVAARLGNTPTICRKCYVHPAVIESYLDGTLVGVPRSLARAALREGAGPLEGGGDRVGAPRPAPRRERVGTRSRPASLISAEALAALPRPPPGFGGHLGPGHSSCSSVESARPDSLSLPGGPAGISGRESGWGAAGAAAARAERRPGRCEES
jgi:hypothetical protein